MPVTILRPFSIYGPFQRSDTEGGVMSIFIKNKLEGKQLEVFGTGEQSRDFFYVDDCAEFVYRAAVSEKANGEILNAGSGKDITIKELAKLISNGKAAIKFVKHHHPQAEIERMICDCTKAKKLLGWKPKISLNEGIKRTEDWIKYLGK
ncbi:MAG: GDP-mannose 4,6-dehydratase [Candidatus Aenigmarchaeota archaeon]|nr:GDP-mannose 4,6-dehydratase [Candidatus Aenigmarchaeota archaeon]